MIAAWSLWSKPIGSLPFGPWGSEKNHYLSWILSFETARKHFPKTCLFTDPEGARTLVDGLGLDFSHVTTDYDRLDTLDANWWALAKIYSYARMEEPFVHVDSDVYLWNGLPDYLHTAPVLGQNPEHFQVGNAWYLPDRFDLLAGENGWVPEEAAWYNTIGEYRQAVCCGIFGGCNLEFIRHYATNAIRLVEDDQNRAFWARIGCDNILVEQYYLTCCLEYYTQKAKGSFQAEVAIRYLFDSMADAFNPEISGQKGFTHLIGGAKRNENLMQRLENRVRCDYPEAYERCIRFLEKREVA